MRESHNDVGKRLSQSTIPFFTLILSLNLGLITAATPFWHFPRFAAGF
jgi:hypothetical protein